MEALQLIKPYIITALWVVFGLLIIYCLLVLVRTILNLRALLSRHMAWLEITPPASINKTPAATEQLFSVLHGLRVTRRLKDKILNREPVMSFEIVSTKQHGIRYLVQVEKQHAQAVHKMIVAYIPDAKVKQVKHETASVPVVIEFKQAGHFVLPLTLTSAVEEHDPLSYVTSAMANLRENEQLTLQLVAKPIKLREAERLSHRILGNENILQQVGGQGLSKFSRGTSIAQRGVQGIADLTSEIYVGTTYGHKNYYDSKQKQLHQQTAIRRDDRPARTLSVFELELMDTMHKKVSKPLFQVSLRLLINSDTPKEHLSALRSSLDGFSVPQYQSLRKKPQLPPVQTTRVALARRRLPTLFQRNALILSSSELASLYHFPASDISKTDNLITSLSRTLPAPVSLKQGTTLDVAFGMNRHNGVETLIGLTGAERQRHIYIIGGTGNGKTTMLLYGIVQDMQAGKGIAVLDPHGDLAETILRHVPEDRIQDVIYMNPDDLMHPVGINLLELDASLTGDDLLREKDLITESTISVLRKIFSEDDSGGHRIEYVLRNTIQTALTVEGATLFTIFRLLNDQKYRRSVTKALEDQDLKNFWDNELGKAGEFQRVKMAAGITAKIGRFLFSASAKRILEQEKSSVDFYDVINSGKILICNFSKGLLGEDTSTLFGTTVLAKLQVASLKRARLQQTDRRPFYLYVDEFQNFATMSFVQMLSEARKYKLFLTMAEQSTSQQDEQRLVDIILANVGTVICFRSGSPSDERLMLPLFSPYIEQGEIANLPAYTFYCRIAALQAQEPMSGQTMLLEQEDDHKIAERAIAYSRKAYGTKQKPEVAQIRKSAPKKAAPSKKQKTQVKNAAPAADNASQDTPTN